jgi:ribonucleoside-triphosphate reductase
MDEVSVRNRKLDFSDMEKNRPLRSWQQVRVTPYKIIMQVSKRDGRTVPYDRQKIKDAITKAFQAVQPNVDNGLSIIGVTDQVNMKLMYNKVAAIEEIQDLVEKALMEKHHYEVAKAYILYRDKRAQERLLASVTKKPAETKEDAEFKELCAKNSAAFGNNPMREFVYMRTYSRWIERLGRREIWSETIDRYVQFLRAKIGSKLSEKDYEDIRQYIFEQKVMPSMRLLQFAGPAASRCNVCVYNCAFSAPTCFKDLADIMYLSMSGTGVGFSVEEQNVAKFPNIMPLNGFNIHMIIDDSKEGWCDALQFGLTKWFEGTQAVFDYSRLRPAGARLKTMGGRSSGPKPLMDLMKFTEEIIEKRRGTTHRLSTLDVHDIICKIGQIVVSGGVRRSALISISDFADQAVRDCKKGNFWLTDTQRCLANNSAAYDQKPDQLTFMKEWISLAESGTGERGIFNRGSLGKVIPQRRVDLVGDKIGSFGMNPCAEVLLQPFQFCNLTEIVLRAEDTFEQVKDKMRVATLIGTCQAYFCDFKYIDPKWKANQEAERLLGVSITGIYDRASMSDLQLQELRDSSIRWNREYAQKLGINPATAITCVKPSGTVSQMVDASSGIHPRFARYYIRRIRISATDPLLQLMKDQGYPCLPEVGQFEPNISTWVLEFAVQAPTGATTVKDVAALEQLETWLHYKRNFTEHNPSVTIYVKSDEWLSIGNWVWNNWDYITGLSFLPYSDHIYELAPYEAISEEKFLALSSKIKKVDFSKLRYYEKSDTTDVKKELACVGGVCEL